MIGISETAILTFCLFLLYDYLLNFIMYINPAVVIMFMSAYPTDMTIPSLRNFRNNTDFLICARNYFVILVHVK